MAGPVVSPSDQDPFYLAPEQGSGAFGANLVSVTQALGLKGLGCMVVSVEPGKRAFPFHNHLGNDEMFIVIEGQGTYRMGAADHPIKAGDICAAPRGGPDTAHQIINTGTGVLRYYGISTMNDPDVVEYPDSGKFAALAIAPGSSFFDAHLTFHGKLEDRRDYWEGEPL